VVHSFLKKEMKASGKVSRSQGAKRGTPIERSERPKGVNGARVSEERSDERA